jgi:hypothetical protein
MSLLRELLFLALATALSAWLFLSGASSPASPEPTIKKPDRRVLPVSVVPEVVAAEPVAAEAQRPEPQEQIAAIEPEDIEPDDIESPEPIESREPEEQEPAPATPERGTPEGDEDGTRPATAAGSEGTGRRTTDDLKQDPELAAAARAELSGELRRGFDTVLLAAPEEQLEIARAFGEELVLVPRRALDPKASPHYFRLDRAGDVERVPERPPLELRRYRDLFDYEYARLPEALRLLRRSVLSRAEVYVFAALIPLSEWAVVVGRRSEALEESGLAAGDVRRFDLRYIRSAQGGFDLQVENIVLANGRVVRTEPGR